MNPTSETTTRQTTLKYLPGLDGLRAISVLAVIFFHHYFIFGSERGWAAGGFLGVEVFFVVSGYLITSLLLAERRERGRISLKNFWMRRARRLLPALWLLLAVVTAYSLLFLPDSIETLKGDVIAALFYVSNWWQIIVHRAYNANAGRQDLLKHLWSLAIEEQFYILWPPVLVLGLRTLGRSRMLVAMFLSVVASTVLLAVISLVSINFAYYATFTRLSGLLLGSMLAFYFAPYRIRGTPGPQVRVALNVAGGVGLAALLLTFHFFTFPAQNTGNIDRSVFIGGFAIVDLATLLVIAAAVHPASDWGRILGVAPLRWIGVRSYGLYLWHYPIFCITRPRVDFSHFFYLSGWPVLLLRLVLTFGAAEISYRFVERPIRGGAIRRYRERLRDAHGERRRQLRIRGAFTLGSLTLIAVLLGTGLASAQPQTKEVAGPTNGAQPDPNALALLRGEPTTTTTTTIHGSASTRTTVKTAQHPTSTTVAPKVKQTPAHVLAIGDSVMLGASNALQATIPGIAVDAIKSRQFGEAVGLVGFYKEHNVLPNTIVIHLGTNGRATDGAIDQIMSLVGNDTVYFLTARVPRTWEPEVNDVLHRAAQRHKNLKVLEWRDYSGCHDDWFVGDGFHLQSVGRQNYAQFVKAGISGHPLTACKK